VLPLLLVCAAGVAATPGQVAAYESNYRVGAPVVHELLGDWRR
jgi:purine nucleoside permease